MARVCATRVKSLWGQQLGRARPFGACRRVCACKRLVALDARYTREAAWRVKSGELKRIRPQRRAPRIDAQTRAGFAVEFFP